MKPKSKIVILIILLLSLSLVGTSVMAQQIQFASPILVVNVSFLNVRSGPGVEFSTVVTVTGGTQLPVLATSGDNVWYQVNTDAGVGWVNIEYTLPRGDFRGIGLANTATTIQQAARADVTSGAHLVVNTGALNVRSGPGAEFDVVASFRGGTELAVVGRNSNGSWLMVSGSFGRGWMNSEFVLFRGDFASVPLINNVASSPTTTTTASSAGRVSGQRVIVNTYALNIRSGPAAGYSIITTASGGTELAVAGRLANTSWYLVSGNFGRGWLNSEFVIFRGDFSAVPVVSADTVVATAPVTIPQSSTSSATVTTPSVSGPRVVINTGALNIRTGPNAGFSIVDTKPGGTTLAVTGRTADGFWYLVTGDFGTGWLSKEFVVFRGDYGAVPIVNVRA